MESEAQKRANRKWRKNNKSKQDYYRNKSATKKFISTQATLADLKLVKKLSAIRKREL